MPDNFQSGDNVLVRMDYMNPAGYKAGTVNRVFELFGAVKYEISGKDFITIVSERLLKSCQT